MRYKKWIAFAVLTAAFLVTRLPGITHVYHQDEYKWARIVKPSYGEFDILPHPPFSKYVFAVWGNVFGYDALRGASLLFAVAGLIIGFFLVRRWYGQKTAWVYALFATVITANGIASTQIDIDGAMLPFWTLIFFWGMTEAREGNRTRGLWIRIFATLGGLATKLSFTLVLLTWATEVLIRYKKLFSKKMLYASVLGFVAFIVLWNTSLLDQFLIFQYAKGFGFLNILTRDYFELILLVLKTTVTMGPIVLVALYGAWMERDRYQLLLLYTFWQGFFYFVLFDFTHRTMERYLFALLFPVTVIAADTLVRLWREGDRLSKQMIACVSGSILTLLALVVFLPKTLLPLHPKSAFVQALIHGQFSFLIPISGGSGPLGFFVPADVTLVAFLLVSVGLGYALYRIRTSAVMATIVFVVCVTFSTYTTAEWLTGWQFGNSSVLTRNAMTVVQNTPDITRVITYNDIGAWELGEMGKYYKRFYLNPEFAETNKKKFSNYDGFYLVIGMPPLQPEDPSMKYFKQCKSIWHDVDGRIAGDIFDCRGISYAP